MLVNNVPTRAHFATKEKHQTHREYKDERGLHCKDHESHTHTTRGENSGGEDEKLRGEKIMRRDLQIFLGT